MSPECQSESQAAQKAALRAAVRDVVDSISLARRCDASVALRQRLAVQRIWQNAASILLFAPMADEPDLWPMLELGLAAGRLIALPRFVGASGR
jgi:5-formyltetrahydrofolate cyclo-ligase